jgi:hypothetical protein
MLCKNKDQHNHLDWHNRTDDNYNVKMQDSDTTVLNLNDMFPVAVRQEKTRMIGIRLQPRSDTVILRSVDMFPDVVQDKLYGIALRTCNKF